MNKFWCTLLVSMLLLPFIPYVDSSLNYIIEGDRVFIDDANAYIGAYPHTIDVSQYVYLDVISKKYSGDIDICFGFDSSVAKPKSLELYAPYDVERSADLSSYWNNPNYQVNYTSSHVDIYQLVNQRDLETDEILSSSWDLIYSRDYEWNVGTTIYWNEVVEWKNVANLFTKRIYEYGGMNTWYYAKHVFIEDREYNLRFFLDVLPQLDEADAKYFIALKPSSDTIHEAKMANRLYVLDPWLAAGWDQRVPVEIDSGDVATVLTNFPVLLNISDGAGINDEDITFIFDEIGANSQKMALTSSDGQTQLYAEVESWNATSELAYVWVQVPTVSNTSDTLLYLYYDIDQSDNSAYIGVYGDSTAANVWPHSEYMAVYHMPDNTTSSILDSTDLNKDGTKFAANEPIEAAGQVNSAQSHDGTDDMIDLNSDDFDFGTGPFFIMAWVYADNPSTADDPIISNWNNDVSASWDLRYGWGGVFFNRLFIFMTSEKASNTTGKVQVRYHTKTIIPTNWWMVSVCREADNDFYMYVNEEQEKKSDVTTDLNSTTEHFIGKFQGYPAWYDGTIDEIRVLNVSKSYTYVNATYQTTTDHLLDWGTMQIQTETVTSTFYTTEYTTIHSSTTQTSCDSFYSTATSLSTTSSLTSTCATATITTTGSHITVSQDVTISVDESYSIDEDATIIIATTSTSCLTTSATFITTITGLSTSTFSEILVNATTVTSAASTTTYLTTSTFTTTFTSATTPHLEIVTNVYTIIATISAGTDYFIGLRGATRTTVFSGFIFFILLGIIPILVTYYGLKRRRR